MHQKPIVTIQSKSKCKEKKMLAGALEGGNSAMLRTFSEGINHTTLFQILSEFLLSCGGGERETQQARKGPAKRVRWGSVSLGLVSSTRGSSLPKWTYLLLRFRSLIARHLAFFVCRPRTDVEKAGLRLHNRWPEKSLLSEEVAVKSAEFIGNRAQI